MLNVNQISRKQLQSRNNTCVMTGARAESCDFGWDNSHLGLASREELRVGPGLLSSWGVVHLIVSHKNMFFETSMAPAFMRNEASRMDFRIWQVLGGAQAISMLITFTLKIFTQTKFCRYLFGKVRAELAYAPLEPVKIISDFFNACMKGWALFVQN